MLARAKALLHLLAPCAPPQGGRRGGHEPLDMPCGVEAAVIILARWLALVVAFAAESEAGTALPERHFCCLDRDVMAADIAAVLVHARMDAQRLWPQSPDLFPLHLLLFQDLGLHQGSQKRHVERQGKVRNGWAETAET